jgi:hypothetical protein
MHFWYRYDYIENSINTLNTILLLTLSILLQPVIDTGLKGKALSPDATYSPFPSTRPHVLKTNYILPLSTSVNPTLRQYLSVIC